MQTGFITALQPFGITVPQGSARRADEPGQAPAEKLGDGQAERDRAKDRAADPGVGGTSRADLIDGSLALVAQESRASENAQDPNGLTEEERRVLSELKQRDAEVRAHEAAHKAAGGAHAGGVSFSYQQGPDGRRYAVGGEVPIDISTVSGDPQATARKMQQIRRAALAPADPSGPDRAIAAAATKALLEAQAQIASQRAAEISGESEPDSTLQVGHPAEDNTSDRSDAEAATIAGRSDRDNPEQSGNDASPIHGNAAGTPVGDGVDSDTSSARPELSQAGQLPDLPYAAHTPSRDEQNAPTLSILA